MIVSNADVDPKVADTADDSSQFLWMMNARDAVVDFRLPEAFTEADIELHSCAQAPEMRHGVVHLPARSTLILALHR